MSDRRRSTRIIRKPVEVITISSSEDDESEPLPRQTAILQDDQSELSATPSPVLEIPQQHSPQQHSPQQHQQQQQQQHVPQHQQQHVPQQRPLRPSPTIPTPNLITPSPTPPPPRCQGVVERSKRRKLMLDKIIGAVNLDGEFLFVVRWQGLTNMERIPMKDLSAMFPNHVIEFMFQRIKWGDEIPSPPPPPPAPSQPSQRQAPPPSEPVPPRNQPEPESRAPTPSPSGSSGTSGDSEYSTSSDSSSD